MARTGTDDPALSNVVANRASVELGENSTPQGTPIPNSDAARLGNRLCHGLPFLFACLLVASGTANATVPAAPEDFTVTGGDGRVVLAWTDPDDASILRWEYLQKVGNGDFGDWIPIPDSGADTTTYTVENRRNGVIHIFDVRAVNDTGNGRPSAFVWTRPVPAPARPRNFTATAGDGRVVLAWTNPRDRNIVRWEYRQKTGADAYGVWIPIPDSSADTTTYTVENLDNGVVHVFRARAVNAIDNGKPSASASATPAPAPAKPEGLTATGGDGAVVLAWTDPGDDSIAGWEYRRKTGEGDYGDWIPIPNSNADTAGYAVGNLDNGVVHVFQVRAVNTAVASAASDEATATMVPARPRNYTATKPVTCWWCSPGSTRTMAASNGWEYRQKTGDGDYGDWINIPDSDADTEGAHGREPRQRRGPCLPGTGGERHRQRQALRQCQRDADPGPGQAGGVHGDGRRRGGRARLDRSGRRQHRRVGIPAEDRRRRLRGLDPHPVPQCRHRRIRGREPRQRRGPCLPGAGGEHRWRQRGLR